MIGPWIVLTADRNIWNQFRASLQTKNISRGIASSNFKYCFGSYVMFFLVQCVIFSFQLQTQELSSTSHQLIVPTRSNHVRPSSFRPYLMLLTNVFLFQLCSPYIECIKIIHTFADRFCIILYDRAFHPMSSKRSKLNPETTTTFSDAIVP